MVLIKNLHLLTDVSEKDKEMMEHAALEHIRHNNITFKIHTYNEWQIVFKVYQGKNAAGAYHDKKRLVEIAKETFGRFFPGKKFLAHGIEYVPSPPCVVTDEWIRNKMTTMGIALKTMEADMDIVNTQLSALINGIKPLSQPMKALFYYYFLSKK